MSRKANLMCFTTTIITLLLLYYFTVVPRSTPGWRADGKAPSPRANLYSAAELLHLISGVGNYDEFAGARLDYIRRHVSRPSGTKPVLRRAAPGNDYSQIGQSRVVDRLLDNLTNGFFIECGAATGEALSNSLYFEMNRNWTGLLIEANSAFYEELFSKQRNAFIFPGCLSPHLNVSKLKFQLADVYGGLVEKFPKDHAALDKVKRAEITSLVCFPLSVILEALGVQRVNYLSLDVEGGELSILQTIDFNKITINVVTLEYGENLGRLEKFRDFFHSTGLYEEVMFLPEGRVAQSGQDVVFKRRQSRE